MYSDEWLENTPKDQLRILLVEKDKLNDKYLERGMALKSEIHKLKSKRSLPHHRRFFQWVSKLWEHIPEDDNEAFGSVDRMRKWLLVMAGYKKVVVKDASEYLERIEASHVLLPEQMTEEIKKAIIFACFAVAKDAAKQTDDTFVVEKDGCIEYHMANSQGFDKMNQEKFHEVESKMKDIVQKRFSISVDEMLAVDEQTA